MRVQVLAVVISMTFTAAPVVADDCGAAIKAIVETARHPVSITVTSTSDQGQSRTTQTIQTVENKYVQTADGKWYATGIAMKDLTDNTQTASFTCKRLTSENFKGEPTTVFQVRMDDDGNIVDQKIWVGSKNLVLKTDGTAHGVHYSAVYDFTHVTPPANAVVMGEH